jgi:hypothetical protein
MRIATHFVLPVCAAALVGCASQPPAGVASQTAAAPVAVAPAAAASPAAGQTAAAPQTGASVKAAAQTASQTGTTQKASGQANAMAVVEIQGYRRTVIDGQERFCKTETETGSRVKRQEQCYTQAQLDQKEQGADDYIHQLQKNSGTALHPNAGGYGAMGH